MSEDPTAAQRAGFPNVDTLHVIGVFDSDQPATAAERALERATINRDTISVVAKPHGAPARLSAGDTNAEQGTLTGVAAGAMIGGLAAVALAIPGVGPLLAAGPLAALVSGSLVGGALGGIVGSFVGLGTTTQQAQEYEAMVSSGAIVVDVFVASDTVADTVSGIMAEHGAHHVTSYEKHL